MRFWSALALVLAVAGAVYVAPARVVLGGSTVRLLGDTDPHYHVLRAERILHGPPGAAWHDPSLDSPNGAEVPWPPLFDLALAASARLAGATTREEVAAAVVALPALLGLCFVLTVGLVGRHMLGPHGGVAAAATVALLPAVARYAIVGRVDQHVAEILLAVLIAGAFARGLRADRLDPWAIGGLATGIALSFWTWMGSTVSLVPPATTLALARLAGVDDVSRRSARVLAMAASSAALMMATSVWLFAPAGTLFRTSVLGITGLHCAIVAGVAGYSWILLWRSCRPASLPWRAVDILVALTVPAGILFLTWPGLLDGVRRGLVALAAANPWYADIREFSPALFGGVHSLPREMSALLGSFGLIPLLACLGLATGGKAWRSEPASRPRLLFLWVWAATTLLLALSRNRFFPYFAAPGALAAATGAEWLSRRLALRLRSTRLRPLPLAVLAIAACLLPVAGSLLSLSKGEERIPDRWIDATRWLSRAPVAPDGRTAVGAPWSLGHLIQYYGNRSVIVSPFGTEAGPRAMPDWARLLHTVDEREAEASLLARRVSHLVLGNPSHELVGLRGFRPESAPPPLLVSRNVWSGESVRATERYGQLVVSRLFFDDGASPEGTSMESLRLVHEGPSTRPPHPLLEERLKVFELVAGARLRVRGLEPGATVRASTWITTSTGRPFTWVSSRVADAFGAAIFRVPYASGRNGDVRAGAYEVSSNGERAWVVIGEDAVGAGSVVGVTLSASPGRPADPKTRLD